MDHRVDRRAFVTGSVASGIAVAAGAALATSKAYADMPPAEAPKDSEESQGSQYGTVENTDRVVGYCGPGDWLGTAPEIPADQIEVVGDYDMVILGSGHAGVAAAFSAIDEGLSLAVIEAQPWDAFIPEDGSDGSGWYGCYIGHVNSQFLIDRGFGPYDTGEIVTEFTKRAAGRCNPDIVRSFVQNSGAMFDRYHEIYDMYEEQRKESDSNVYLKNTQCMLDGEFVPSEGNFDMSDMFARPLCNTQCCHFDDVEYPVEAGGYKTWPCNVMFWGYHGNDIEWVHKWIVQYVKDNGGEYYFETTGIKLVTDETGRVTGLIAQDADGNYKQYNAKKGVLLASGDYIGNPDMCWALLNEGMEWGERAGAVKDEWVFSGVRAGAGHKMACWLGAMIEPSPRGFMANGGGVDGPWGGSPLLQLDANGERMYNEASIPQMPYLTKRLLSPQKCWVSDANWRETIGRAPLDHGCPDFGYEDYWTQMEAGMDAVVPGPEPCEVTTANLPGRTFTASVYAAETLDELADYLGYEGEAKETFLATIAHYNELCHSETGDTDFGKDQKYMVPIETPPFYAGTARGDASTMHSVTPMMVTLNGLLTDKDLNVVNSNWEPIPGLYAAGNTLGNRFGLGYSTPFAGCSIGMAMTHGYLAAKTIAKL